ncbi:MAG: hypothetical protein ABI837_16650 [Acidobacteriota bacterium]
MKNFAARSVIAVTLLSLGATGCASIVHGRHQQVAVVSDPAGATVIADCGNGPRTAGETPVVVKVSRKADRCLITIRKEGFEDESVVLARHLSGWLWGNLLLPYAVPAALVDLFDGAAYRRAPAAIDLRLQEVAYSSSSSAAGSR